MNSVHRTASLCERSLGWVLPAAAWVSFAQVGLKYLLWLAVMGLSLAVIDQRKRWRSTWRQPGPMLLLLWVGWMWISAWWSSAPTRDIIIHGWIYALPLGAIAIGAACPPAVAQRSLLHFMAASACVGGLWAVHSRGGLPVSPLWHSTLAATGNQRIMASVLLALGAVLACWFLARQTRPWPKVGLALAALLAAAGLISQDRRSGMVLLPLLLLVWALALPRPPLWRASGVLAVAVAMGAVWLGSDTVRTRFAEGSAELAAYNSQASVDTSWGIRLRMLEITADMVKECPAFGHGLGSWQQQWDQRVPAGTRLADNSTPHNDYLMVAAQAGVPAAMLMLAWLLVMMVAAVRAGPMGMAALMVWFSIAATALANATLRDAKFGLPLLLLAGLAMAMLDRDKSPPKPEPRMFQR